MTLQEKAEELARVMFLGGPAKDFETIGRLQLTMLLKHGLYPHSKVLDIGCGALRGGYWLIHFLNPGCYFGLEPNRTMLDAGIAQFLEPGVLETKRPTFSDRNDFDASVFGVTFDYFLARSVWPHASKGHIALMLDVFARTAAPGGVFLASYWKARWPVNRDYRGTEWVGRSHTSDRPGAAYHSFGWVRSECARRELRVAELGEGVYNNQIWLKITKPSAP